MMTPEERARFRQEVRSRIALIAAERSLPKSETAKVMGRLNTRDVVVCGAAPHQPRLADLRDLKGLLRTVRWRQAIAR
jgi:hypothetical protein